MQVSPGDATVRRHTDQLITAQTPGLLSPQIVLYARYQSAAKWEQVAMQPRSGASGYQFVFTGVPENVEYYVEAGAATLAALQHPRRGSAVGQADQGHLSLSVVDGVEGHD